MLMARIFPPEAAVCQCESERVCVSPPSPPPSLCQPVTIFLRACGARWWAGAENSQAGPAVRDLGITGISDLLCSVWWTLAATGSAEALESDQDMSTSPASRDRTRTEWQCRQFSVCHTHYFNVKSAIVLSHCGHRILVSVTCLCGG